MSRLHSLKSVSLAAALLASTALGALPAPTLAADTAADITAGKAVVFDRKKGNCLACHDIAGGSLTGNVGPALNNMKARFPDRKLLRQRIYDEMHFNPRTVMPPFGRNKILTDHEIDQVVDYLLTL